MKALPLFVFLLSAESAAKKILFFTDARISVRFCGKNAFTLDANKVRHDFALLKIDAVLGSFVMLARAKYFHGHFDDMYERTKIAIIPVS